MNFFSLKNKLLLLSTALIALTINTAHAITIDEFLGDALLSASTNGFPVSQVVSNSSAIGGKRSMYVRKDAGTGDILVRTLSGRLKSDQGNDDTGIVFITWDADNIADGGTPSNPIGLGGVDLTQDNGGAGTPADSFIIKLSADLGFNQPITLKMYIYSGQTSGSVASIVIGADLPTETNISIPFANFAPISGSFTAAQFTNVGAIVLEINGSNAANDIDIRSITTNGECPDIPVNGTVYTVCNKCLSAPNNMDCLDCLGVPFGTAKPGAACDTGDVGVCKDGTYQANCSCKRITEPGTEICDGKDNDCDGQVDENTDVCGICGGDGKSCLDCAGKPFGTAIKDACGVCNGDNKSCVDCAGTPNGSAIKDKCGVCNGDNKSCVDCAGTPNGPAIKDKCGVCNGDNTSCLDCRDEDNTDNQFEMDHGAKLHEKLINKMLKALTNLDNTAATKSYATTTSAKIHVLQLRNWALSWTIVSKVTICGNTVLCEQTSNLGITDEYRKHSEELRNVGVEVIAKLKKLKYNTKKFAKDNENRHKTNVALANKIPASFSTGCHT
jgi:hypothetical protein